MECFELDVAAGLFEAFGLLLAFCMTLVVPSVFLLGMFIGAWWERRAYVLDSGVVEQR